VPPRNRAQLPTKSGSGRDAAAAQADLLTLLLQHTVRQTSDAAVKAWLRSLLDRGEFAAGGAATEPADQDAGAQSRRKGAGG
jgi:hypothetical protein